MNAPWGLAVAPAGFGKASGLLLVGQFGSGKIATFDAATGEFEGLLRGLRGRPITIDGLWALRFGNGANAGPVETLFFTAGIDDEQHGLFGTITPIPKKDESNPLLGLDAPAKIKLPPLTKSEYDAARRKKP